VLPHERVRLEQRVEAARSCDGRARLEPALAGCAVPRGVEGHDLLDPDGLPLAHLGDRLPGDVARLLADGSRVLDAASDDAEAGRLRDHDVRLARPHLEEQPIATDGRRLHRHEMVLGEVTIAIDEIVHDASVERGANHDRA